MFPLLQWGICFFSQEQEQHTHTHRHTHTSLSDFVLVISCFSHVQLFATLWTVAHQALLSMGFSRQGYWSGLPFPPPGDLPDPGIEPVSLASPALASRFFTTSITWEDPSMTLYVENYEFTSVN